MNMVLVLLAGTLLMCSAMTIGHDDLEEEEISADGSLPGDPKFTKCKICQLVMKMVKAAVSDPTDVEKLADKLHSVCAKIPKWFQKKCKKFIHENFKKMLNDLAANDDVQTICVDVNMCEPDELLDIYYSY